MEKWGGVGWVGEWGGGIEGSNYGQNTETEKAHYAMRILP